MSMIAKGDLVMVVHRCCEQSPHYGWIGTVAEVDATSAKCPPCGHVTHGLIAIFASKDTTLKRTFWDWVKNRTRVERTQLGALNGMGAR